MPVIAHAGELILNTAQQQNVARALVGSGGINISIMNYGQIRSDADLRMLSDMVADKVDKKLALKG